MPSWSRLGAVLDGFGTVLGRFWGRFGGSWGVLSVVLGVFARSSGVSVGLVGSWRRRLIFGPLLIPAFVLLHVACWVPAACLRNSRQCNALPVPMLSQVYVEAPFRDFLGLFFDLVFMLVSGLVLGAFWGAFGAQNVAQNRSQDGQKRVLEPTSEKQQKMMRNRLPKL